MRIFVAGATGVIGKRLVPLLVSRGHEVIATTRSVDKEAGLRALGATPVVMDGLQRERVLRAVRASKPDVIVHQMTALSQLRNLKRFDDEFALTNRLRTEGTDHLVEAAHAAGTKRLVAQSFTGWTNIRDGGRVKTEADPFDPHPPRALSRTLAAIQHVERVV